MKRLFTLLVTILFTIVVFAQAPEKMSYQAVIRNSSNQLVTNHAVGMRVSILLGSETGTEVYKEIYNPNPQTNANGLVTIEIGGGIPLTGTFAAINWSVGTYFIKTETDPLGGTTYTITGTSQLLSVPYALYAKTADNVTGIVVIANGGTGATSVSGAKSSLGLGNVDNTTDLLKPISTATQTAMDLKAPLASPTFTGTVSGITSTMVGLGNIDNTTDLLKPISTATQTAMDFKAPLASPTFTGTPLSTTAAVGTSTTQIATTEFVTSALNARVPAHYIGESYGGGIVFYAYDNGQHGLIVATTDQSSSIRWYAGTYTNTMAKTDGVGAGKANTAMIIANQGNGDGSTYAARICNEYSVAVDGVTYGEWYLPSKFELNLLYLQKSVAGSFTSISGYYWSSTEWLTGVSWVQRFTDGGQSGGDKNNSQPSSGVRAIRSF
jgi:hypothetical protein